MHLFTNVGKSRNVAPTAFLMTSFAVVVSWMIISPSAVAGLIEAAKDTSCQASTAKEEATSGSGQLPVMDTATNKIQAVSLFLTHAHNLMNATSVHNVKSMDLSAVLGSKDLGITLGEIKMAIMNAHIYARLKISSADSINHQSLCCGENQAISIADQQGFLSSQFKSFDRDLITQLQIFNPEDSGVFLHVGAPSARDERVATSQSTAPAFVTTFINTNHTVGNSSQIQVPRRTTKRKELELTDKNEQSEGCVDELSDEESSNELAAEDDRLLLSDVDSFDPLMASVALLIFGAIALLVTSVPRKYVLKTQL